MSALDLVLAGTGDPGAREAVAAAVGSAPEWFRLADEPSGPHAVWVLADDDTWPDEVVAAAAGGAGAVVVDSPRLVTPDQLARLAAAGRTVIVATQRSHAPQLAALAGLVGPVRDEVTWVEALVVENGEGPLDAAAALWDALATLAAAGLPVDSVERLVATERALLVDARSAQARVHATCVRSLGATPRVRVAAFGSFGSLAATAGDPLVAAPGEVVQVGPDGARAVPTDYQTPRRLALREAHAVVAAGLVPASPPSAYEREAALVERAVRAAASRS
jgi:hypothetical protein